MAGRRVTQNCIVGLSTVDFIPKIKLEIVTSDSLAAKVVQIIEKVAKTGKIGDGKIFVYEVEEVIRIRTGEQGETAV